MLFFLALASYAYFAHDGGWNHNSRLDLARALVEEHRVAIDDYQANTGDKATLGGHVYSDKAPLTALMAAVPYAVVWTLAPASWRADRRFGPAASYLVTLAVCGLAAATTTLLLYQLARRHGAGPGGAIGVALAYGLGSYAFPFATVLFGHVPAAAFLVGALAAGERARGRAGLALAGLFGGAAVVTELPTAGAVLLVLVYLARTRRDAVLPVAAGALAPATIGLGYAWVTFHDVFAIGYQHLTSGDMGRVGFFGLTWPHPLVAVELLAGWHRGLFLGAPVLLLAAVGLVAGVRRDPICGLGAAVCGYFVLLISAYAWWDGGRSFGPRHLIPMLPFLCLGGLRVAEGWPRLFAGLLAVSAVAMLAGAARSPVAPANWGVLQVVARGLADPIPHDSTSFGRLVGLPNPLSLAPLLGVWGLAALAIVRAAPAPKKL
jgi:hypothetical protein